MKKFIYTACILILSAAVQASECVDYLSELYSCQYDAPVKIKSKLEVIDKYEQKIGNEYVSSIVYGQADLKIKHRKKMRVSYICLLKSCTEKPMWGYIIPR